MMRDGTLRAGDCDQGELEVDVAEEEFLIMAQTELQIGSLGKALTGVRVACSSESKAWEFPPGIKRASPPLSSNVAPLSMRSRALPWLTKWNCARPGA